MKLSKTLTVSALALSLLLGSGATALAAASSSVDVSKLTGFTDAQKAAITRAFEIRRAAEVEAQKVLTAAGVDEKKLHEAMRTDHKALRAKLHAALDANDIVAFKALVKGTPMENKLSAITAETFAKLVEARKLELAGDHKGAMEIRRSIGININLRDGKEKRMRVEWNNNHKTP